MRRLLHPNESERAGLQRRALFPQARIDDVDRESLRFRLQYIIAVAKKQDGKLLRRDPVDRLPVVARQRSARLRQESLQIARAKLRVVVDEARAAAAVAASARVHDNDLAFPFIQDIP